MSVNLTPPLSITLTTPPRKTNRDRKQGTQKYPPLLERGPGWEFPERIRALNPGKPTAAAVPHNCAHHIGGRLVVAVRKNIASLVAGKANDAGARLGGVFVGTKVIALQLVQAIKSAELCTA